MSVSRIFSWAFFLLFLACANLFGQAIDALRGTERSGLQLGNRKQALLGKHPRMVPIPNETLPTGPPSTLEIYVEMTNAEERMALFYFFKDDVLRAVSVTKGFGLGQEEQSALYINEVYGRLAETMTWAGSEETLRSNGLEGFVVTAERWKSKTDGTEVYFVATNKEVTTLQFDPGHVSRKDFLADPAWKAEVDKQGKRLRAKIPAKVLERDAKKMAAGITDAPRPFNPLGKAGQGAARGADVDLPSGPQAVAGAKGGSPAHVPVAPTDFGGGGGSMLWLSLGAMIAAAGVMLWFRKGDRKG
jgi:hypothetical protein